MEPKVVDPSQNRSQATNEKSENKVQEEMSLAASSNAEQQRQAVSNESLDHLTGVLKGNSRTTMSN